MSPRLHQSRRRQLVILAAICLFGLIRGLFSIAMTEAPSVIDEAQHLGYIQSLAEGEGIPTVGHDKLSPEILTLVKVSPTVLWRASPVSPNAGPEVWGTTAEQYEGMQGPVYYALMVPPFWLGRAMGGYVGAMYAVRLATMLLALCAVPITWLIGRRIVPSRPEVALLAAGAIVAMNGPIGTSAAATNDALILPLGGLCVLAVLRVVRTPTPLWLAVAGFTAGITLVAKSTAVSLLPTLAVAVLYAAYRHRARGWRFVTAGAAIAGVGGMVAVLPWIAWNLATYGSVTASKEVEAILGRYQLQWPGGFSGVELLVDGMRHAFWNVAGSTTGYDYQRYWEVAGVAVLIGGVFATWRRFGSPSLVRVGWAAAALPLGWMAMIGLALYAFGGELSVAGRYMYPVMPLVAVAIGACVHAIGGPRLGVVLALALASGALLVERSFDRGYSEAFYETEVFGRLAPVVEQSWGDGFVPMRTIQVDADCPVELIALRAEPRPPSLSMSGSGGETVEARYVEDRPGFNYYRLDRPVPGPVRIDVPAGSQAVVSVAEREARTQVLGGIGDAVVRAYCPVEDADAKRFAQLYPPQHPPLSRWAFRVWADTRVGIAAIALIAASVVAWRRAAVR